jgi:hypothetical protein
MIPLMDINPTVAAALIGAAGTAFGALANIGYSRWDRSREWTSIPSQRFSALKGKWLGSGGDTWVEDGTPALEIEMEMEMTTTGKRLRGDGTVRAANFPPVRLLLDGGFYNQDLLQLNYASKDPVRKQAGVAMLRLSPGGDRLHGRYVGFSPARGCFVIGSLTLARQP